MKRDFTLRVYQEFLNALRGVGYAFQRFQDFIVNPVEKAVVLRHDVDARPENSLEFARIQHRLDIQGTYYFRLVPQSFDPSIIREIAGMGHEIGYHYETMDTADGGPELALKHFEDGLNRLRSIAEVRTICMHGSPLSRYDNRDLWKRYSYRDYGIIGEPYFDLDFARVLYLTDTGRRWDGDKVSVRDRAPSGDLESVRDRRKVGGRDQNWDRAASGDLESVRDRGKVGGRNQNGDRERSSEEVLGSVGDMGAVGERESASGRPSEEVLESVEDRVQQSLAAMYRFRSTSDLIQACQNDELPSQMMINIHPQRWTDDSIPWIREWLMQNVKNVVKRGLIWVRG